ncbi:type 2 lanthipeptide synthetase LanM family protein [Luteimonas aquatica]|uniref:type 2 lanthipeptide synthetase LanM family protein n=1 Tax=Luteimonas aquatica TaxID=450364 RepID=UPI001F57D3C3|nr:type 2 lanthipeptide synthetase LanM family protein [Luteimonas aquatica]
MASALGDEDIQALRPFLRWAAPAFGPALNRVEDAYRNASDRHPHKLDPDTLLPSIEAAFSTPVLLWSFRTLILELALARRRGILQGDTPQERFHAFIELIQSASGRAALERDYPLLRGDIARIAEQVERTLHTLLDRIVQDHAALGPIGHPLGGAVEGIGRWRGFETGLGDRHDDGNTVARLEFEHGSMFYKPRPMAMDAAFARCLRMFMERGIRPAQRTPLVLDRGDYGYAEHIRHVPVDSEAAASAYYHRYGGLIAIAHVVAASDLHFENLIACGEFPVVVDLETLCQPRSERTNHGADGLAAARSILESGLLPTRYSMLDAVDVSGLSAGGGFRLAHRIFDAGSDEMRLAQVQERKQRAHNLPVRGNGSVPLPYAHADSLLEGFRSTYFGLAENKDWLLSKDGPLEPFAGLKSRAVLRSTMIYSRLLDALSHPKYLRGRQAREEALDRLKVGQEDWARLQRVDCAERAALERGDVPRFWIGGDSVDVEFDAGRTASGFFTSSGMQEIRRRVRSLSPGDFDRQRYVLHQSLQSTRLDEPATASAPMDAAPRRRAPRAFEEAALRIASRIEAMRFPDRRHPLFVHLDYASHDVPRLGPMDDALYEGLPGLMLMLSEAGLRTGRKALLARSAAIMASVDDRLRRAPDSLPAIGAFNGLSGWIYALLALGLRQQRPDLVDAALAWVPAVAERIADEQELDVIGGVAGCLLVLLQLHSHRDDARVRAAAGQCADRLMASARRDASGTCWHDAGDGQPDATGFAHGSAGIAAALARYAVAFEDPQCLQAALSALARERTAYERRQGSWYDLDATHASGGMRKGSASWCHGASGVGMARLLWPRSLRDAAWRQDVQRCLDAVLASLDSAAGHSLCHGSWGNLDFPLEWAVQSGDAALLARCRRLADALLVQGRNGWVCGGRTESEMPLGLMVGLSGIAYACLRAADPQHVPSILSLNVPPGPH